MYLIFRIVHVLFGALWVGMVLSSVVFVTPILGILGPDAGKVMSRLQNRVFVMPLIATLAVLSGLWLYWQRGYMGAGAGSHAGMTFGAGAVLGIAAYAIGAAVISRSLVKATALSEQIAAAAPGDRAQLAAAAAALRARAGVATQIVLVLLVLTTILMAAGLYV